MSYLSHVWGQISSQISVCQVCDSEQVCVKSMSCWRNLNIQKQWDKHTHTHTLKHVKRKKERKRWTLERGKDERQGNKQTVTAKEREEETNEQKDRQVVKRDGADPLNEVNLQTAVRKMSSSYFTSEWEGRNKNAWHEENEAHFKNH